MFGSWQNDGTALWWLWCAVCLLFLVSPVVFDGVCSLAGARRTLPSLPLLVPSSALLFCSANKSLFLSHSFFYSLCSRLSWRGKTFPQLSQSPQPPPHPLPFSLTPSFSSLVPFLHPTPLLLLFHSLFCHFLCPLLPSDCLSSLPFIFAFSPSIPPPLFLSLLHSLARTGIT